MKLSIIVPVYKVEKYLTGCLTSLVHQDIVASDYEIIVVNDGSPDNSKAIIFSFQEKCSNIIYIEQENQGVSAARNAGIKIAKGDYILFVDSDDTIAPNCLNAIYNRALADDLDLLFFKIAIFNDLGKYSHNYPNDLLESVIYEGIDCSNRGFIFALYRKELTQKIYFVPDIAIAEDSLFNVMILSMSKRCGFIDIPVYNYIYVKESASRSGLRYSEKGFLSYTKAIDFLSQFVLNNFSAIKSREKLFFDVYYIKTIKSILDYNILPEMSVRRLLILKNRIKVNHLNHLNSSVVKLYPFFNSHWSIFFMAVFFKKIGISLLHRFNLLQIKINQ
jgi:glycosyltransferase involved in cell wall biosynthesis